jgi:hypothetical protein
MAGPGAGAAPPASELVVTTGVRPVWPHVAGVLLGLAAVAGLVWAALSLDGLPGVARGLVTLGLAVVLLVVFAFVGRHLERLASWWTWRRRPTPAMRLTPDGLDYSPAFSGTFDLHVDWAMARESRIRRGAEGAGAFWCLYAPVIEGTGPVSSFLTPEGVPGPDRAPREARRIHRTAERRGEPAGDVDVLTHLLAFGTPIALDLDLARGAPLAEVDARLREWTDGRCSLGRGAGVS